MLREQPRRIIIVGGGIAGLAAAYRLAQAHRRGLPIDECLLEAGDRLGGVILTDYAEGCLVEAGPDSFLREKPEAAALARELGLGDALMGSNDSGRRTYILHRGRLQPLPEAMMLMVSSRIGPVLRSPLISWPSKWTMAREWLTGRAPGGPPPEDDESVSSFVTRHFGDGLLENIVEPLLAGVYGGDSAELSARSVLPRFQQMESKYGSLIRAARSIRRKPAASGLPEPIFMTLRGGLGSLVAALVREIERGRVEFSRQVVRIERAAADAAHPRYRVVLEDGSISEADRVIVALPAWSSAALLASLDPSLSEHLAAIPYRSAVLVALVYPESVRARLPQGFGFLVPRGEGRRLLACTFVHQKFDHRAPPDRALLRCFLGGADNREVLRATDEELLRVVREELAAILGIRDEPLFARVCRWPRAMAQYVVGHHRRLEVIRERLRHLPGIHLAGNAYSGIGVPDAIRTGESAAREALAGLVPESVEVR
ncbi:MAG TPA: protoporphyrinogen oxidase [Terriglobia bacterium]|nr:protoporphyrinogen oxidase [Terriglobia bacterium]